MNLVNEEDIPASRFVRIAARSPARSSTGPEVDFRAAPISWATTLARVVLPRPGGPKISVWSRGSSGSVPRPQKLHLFTDLRLALIFGQQFWSHGAFDTHILRQRVALYNPLFHGVLSICFRLARIRPSGVVSGSVDTELIALRASDSL